MLRFSACAVDLSVPKLKHALCGGLDLAVMRDHNQRSSLLMNA